MSAVLRVMGLEQDPHFQNYHRVLNRGVWSNRKASAILLKQLVQVFAPTGIIVMGIDDTIERPGANGLRHAAYIAMPCALVTSILSKRAD